MLHFPLGGEGQMGIRDSLEGAGADGVDGAEVG